LTKYLSDEPATVFGGSSGTIVALEVLTRHPFVVRTLVLFEPPAVRVLPDGEKWVDYFFGLYDLYRRSGIEPALKTFREHAFAESDRQVMSRARERKNGEYILADTTYWFEHELRQYPAVDLDLDALEAHADRIVLWVGRKLRGYPCYEVNTELGKKLGRDVIEQPGGHASYVAHPAEFARELLEALGR
jgi:pimeloyl-ACP methyl ester carboxylesterase